MINFMPNDSGKNERSLEESLEKILHTGSRAIYISVVGPGKPLHTPHSDAEKEQYMHAIQMRFAVWYAVYSKKNLTSDDLYTASLKACVADLTQWNRDSLLEYYYSHSGQPEIIEFSMAEQIQQIQEALLQAVKIAEVPESKPSKSGQDVERIISALLENGMPAPVNAAQRAQYSWTIVVRLKVWFHYFANKQLPFDVVHERSIEAVERELQDWEPDDLIGYYNCNRQKGFDQFVQSEVQKLLDEEEGEM